MSGGGKGPSRAVVVLFVLVLLLGSAFAYYYLQTSSSFSNLDSRVSSLEQQDLSLQGQVASLQSQAAGLQLNSTAMTRGLSAAETQITALQAEADALLSSQGADRAQLTRLQASLASLNQTVRILETEVAALHPGLSLVSTMGARDGTIDDLKHKVFQAAGLYWAFYQDSSLRFGYQSSADGRSWSTFVPVFQEPAGDGDSANAIYDPAHNRVWVMAGQVYNSSNIDYRFGTPTSNGSILWNGPPRQESAKFINPLPDAAVDSNGVLWNTAVTETSSNVMDVFRNGTLVSSITANATFRAVIGTLVSAGHGGMYALVGSGDWQTGPLEIFSSTDDGATWQGPVVVRGNFLIDGSSAVSVGGELCVVAASSPGPTYFTFRMGDSAVSNLKQLDSLGSNLYVPFADAAMASGGSQFLFVVYTDGSNVYAKTSDDLGASWSARISLVLGTQLINVPFSISPDITNGSAAVEWQTSDYSIWFQTWPVP